MRPHVMRRAIAFEVEIERIPEKSDLRGRILFDGHEVFGKDLGIFNGPTAEEDAAYELTSFFAADIAYYINTRV